MVDSRVLNFFFLAYQTLGSNACRKRFLLYVHMCKVKTIRQLYTERERETYAEGPW